MSGFTKECECQDYAELNTAKDGCVCKDLTADFIETGQAIHTCVCADELYSEYFLDADNGDATTCRCLAHATGATFNLADECECPEFSTFTNAARDECGCDGAPSGATMVDDGSGTQECGCFEGAAWVDDATREAC